MMADSGFLNTLLQFEKDTISEKQVHIQSPWSIVPVISSSESEQAVKPIL
jgi:hypothetical protein